MKKIIKRLIIIPFFACVLSNSLQAVIVGSNTAVSREGQVTFVATDTYNEIRGFAYLDGGFILQDNNTTCTFNGLLPVRGEIALNGGQLFLSTDLITDNPLTFSQLGSIRALAARALSLPSFLNVLGSASDTEYIVENVGISFGGDVTLNTPLRFRGSCVLNGLDNQLSLAATASLIVDAGSQLTLKDMRISGVRNGSVRCDGHDSCLILEDIEWLQDERYVFDKGSTRFSGQVSLSGSTTYQYTSVQTSTVAENSALLLTGGMTLQMGKNQQVGTQPLYFEDRTAELQLNNCHLLITSSGVVLKRGLFNILSNATLDVLSTSSMTGMIFGDGQRDNDMAVRFAPAASLHFNSGHLVYNNGDANTFATYDCSACFSRTANARVFTAQNLALTNLTVHVLSDQALPIQVQTGKVVSFSDTSVAFPSIAFSITGLLDSTGLAFTLPGNGRLFLARGGLPAGIIVSGTGNTIIGNGIVAGPLVLFNSAAQVSMGLVGSIESNPALNGGTMILTRDLRLGNGKIINNGTVNLGSSTLHLGADDMSWTGTVTWIGNGGIIELNSDVALSAVWTFSGDVRIVGNGGAEFSLGPTGGIVVNNGCSLAIKGLRVEGIAGNNMRCQTSNGIITIDNTSLYLDDDFTFTQGAFQFAHQAHIFGEDITFFYESSQTSTIAHGSELSLGYQLTLLHDPVVPLSSTLFNFADSTAILSLNGASLITTATVLDFVGGQLLVRRNSTIGSYPDDLSTGIITFGNGISSASDCRVIVQGTANLIFANGILAYRNVSLSSWSSEDLRSTLVIGSGAYLYLYKTLNVEPGGVFFGENATLGLAEGTDLFGAVFAEGSFNRVSL